MARSTSTNYQPVFIGIAVHLLLAQGIHAAGDDCVPIKTLFEQQIVEENLSGENIGGYDKPGALDLWRENPLRVGSLDGDLVGTSSGRCTLLNGVEDFMCTGMIKISEKDSITYTGLSPNSDEGCKYAITGGTGCYEEAQGSLFTAYRGEDSFLHMYEPGTSNGCVPIEHLVGGGLKETNVINHWAENPLTNLLGDQIGKSYGFCNSYPDSSRQFCIGEWVLDGSGDIITFSGYPPSKTEEGVLAVTGGTGCYAGVGATLSLTVADDDENSFSYGIKSTNEGLPLKTKMKELEVQQLTW